MSRDSNCLGEILVGFLAGAFVGAGVALLFAPYSGSETRGKIKGMASDISNKSVDLYGDAKDKFENFKEDVAKLVDEKIAKLHPKHQKSAE
ncbi:YtxH domain-containing protein [candidate division WOR-3 bacterium]|nr:YtxH domain-containing protein [candidate division WOR-3 bacterium]